MKIEAEIKGAISSKKILIGSKRVLKALKLGNLKTVIIASNCPEKIKKDILYTSKLSKIEMHNFKGNSAELSVVCKKPFKMAVIGIQK